MGTTLLLLSALIQPVIAEPGPVPRQARLDRDGEPLPEGAIARLGSRRWRDPGAERLFVWDSGKVVACFDDDTVRWWDLESGRYLRGWAATGREGTWFSPDGRVAAVRTGDRLDVTDTWNDRPLRTFKLDATAWVTAAVSPDGRTVAVATAEKDDDNVRLRVWDIASGAQRLTVPLRYASLNLAFADGGRLLIVGLLDDTAAAWDLDRRVVRWKLEDAAGFRLDRHGRWLATDVGPDRTLTFFDARTGRALTNTESLPKNVRFADLADIAPDGRTLLIDSEFGFRWDRRYSVEANENRQLPPNRHGYSPRVGAFTPDGRRAVVALGRLELFDVKNRRRLWPDLPTDWGQQAPIRRLSWSADGRGIVTWAELWRDDYDCIEELVWDAETGRLIGPATDRDYRTRRRRDPARFGGWSTEERERRPVPRDAAGFWIPENSTFTVLPDRALLAGGQPSRERRADPPPIDPENPPIPHCGFRGQQPHGEDPSVVEVCTGRPLMTVRVPHLKHLALRPDGRALAVGEPDGIHLYDVPSGRELLVRKVLSYPRSDPTAPAEFGLSFSPDGNRLAVLEAGGTVLVFDVTDSRDRPPLAAGEVDRLWAELASEDPRIGWTAVARLCDHLAAAERLLMDRLTAIAEPDGLAGALADLNAPAFRTREAAERRLLAFGDAARPVVAAALAAGPPTEARARLERLAAALADDRPVTVVDLQRLRALVVLERIGTTDAWLKLRSVANGMPGARVTREAKRAADRLAAADRDRPWEPSQSAAQSRK